MLVKQEGLESKKINVEFHRSPFWRFKTSNFTIFKFII